MADDSLKTVYHQYSLLPSKHVHVGYFILQYPHKHLSDNNTESQLRATQAASSADTTHNLYTSRLLRVTLRMYLNKHDDFTLTKCGTF